MAETYETLIDKMQEWLHVDSVRLPDTAAGLCLNLIQREALRKNDLRFGETEDSFQATAGDREYDLPTGWSRPLSLWFVNPSTESKVDIVRLEKDEFDGIHTEGLTQNTPRHYTIWGSVLLLGPTPDATLTIYRNYYRLLPDLVPGSPGNTNDFVTNAWEVLFFGALAFASQYMLEDPRAPMWQALYMQKLTDLDGEHRREKASGRIPQSRESA